MCQCAVSLQIPAVLGHNLECQDTLGLFFCHSTLDRLRELEIALLRAVVVLECQCRRLAVLDSCSDLLAFLRLSRLAAVQLVADRYVLAVDRSGLLSHGVVTDQELVELQRVQLRAICVFEVLQREGALLLPVSQAAVRLHIAAVIRLDLEGQCAFRLFLRHIALDRLCDLKLAGLRRVVVLEVHLRGLVVLDCRSDFFAFLSGRSLTAIQLVADRHMLAVNRRRFFRHGVIADQELVKLQCVQIRACCVLEVLQRENALDLLVRQAAVGLQISAVLGHHREGQCAFRLFLRHVALDRLRDLKLAGLRRVVVLELHLRCLIFLDAGRNSFTLLSGCRLTAIQLVTD